MRDWTDQQNKQSLLPTAPPTLAGPPVPWTCWLASRTLMRHWGARSAPPSTPALVSETTSATWSSCHCPLLMTSLQWSLWTLALDSISPQAPSPTFVLGISTPTGTTEIPDSLLQSLYSHSRRPEAHGPTLYLTVSQDFFTSEIPHSSQTLLSFHICATASLPRRLVFDLIQTLDPWTIPNVTRPSFSPRLSFVLTQPWPSVFLKNFLVPFPYPFAFLPISDPTPSKYLLSPLPPLCDARLRKITQPFCPVRTSAGPWVLLASPPARPRINSLFHFPQQLFEAFPSLKKFTSLPRFTSFSLDDFTSCFPERPETKSSTFLPFNLTLDPDGHLHSIESRLSTNPPPVPWRPSLLLLETLHCHVFFNIPLPTGAFPSTFKHPHISPANLVLRYCSGMLLPHLPHSLYW